MRRLAFLLTSLVVTAIISTPGHAKGPAFTRTTLSNGATLLVSEQRGVPMVVVQVLVDAGSRRDTPGQEGVAYLTADLLTEGTASRSALEISAATDGIGASLESSCGVDSAYLGLTVLTKHLDPGLTLLTDILLQPSFPAAEVDRRREAILAAMTAAEDQPGHVAGRTFTENIFKGEPYGHTADGTRASITKLGRTEIAAFYRRHYQPDRAIITAVGDIEAEAFRLQIEKRLAAWKPATTAPFSYPPAGPSAPQVIVVPKPIPQANILLGHRGISRDHPDYYAVMVMNFILGGGGFGSRLLDDIRTRAGLAYTVSSGFTAPKSPGSFRIEMQTKSASAREAIELTCGQLRRMRDEPVSDEELQDAKLYLTGSFPLQFDSNGEIASFLSSVEFYGLGADYADDYIAAINAVSAADVQRVARAQIRPDEFLLVVVGDVPAAALPSAPICEVVARP